MQNLEDFRIAEAYGNACARQIARACGMTFDQVVDDLDAALLSRDRQRLNDFLDSRSAP
jgi:hypothetical protein